MTRRDFGLLAAICLLWGANLPLTRWVATDVPPLFLATIRFAAASLCLLPFLKRVPERPLIVGIAGLCMGGLQFALQYLGLANAPASSGAIVAQLAFPLTILLSFAVFDEKIEPRRASGMIMAFGGIVAVVYDANATGWSWGLIYMAASAVSVSIGTVLMKRLETAPLVFQAWSSLISTFALIVATASFEQGQWRALAAAGPSKWAAILYSVLFATIMAQAIYFNLIRRNELSLITPLMLMTPIWAISISVLVLGEQMKVRMLLGSIVTLAGVAIVGLASRGQTANINDQSIMSGS